MTQLSERVRAILEAGRIGRDPTDAQRRVWSALEARIAAGQASPDDAPLPGEAASTGGWLGSGAAKIVVVGVLAVGAAGGLLATRPSGSGSGVVTEPPREAARPTPREVASPLVAPVLGVLPPTAAEQEQAATTAAAPQAPRKPRAAAGRAAAGSRLSEEARLLHLAKAALRAGDPRAALAHLQHHQIRFSGGLLIEERAATRIMALCDLGRRKEARAELERFVRRWPSSPAVEAVRKACVSEGADQ